MEELAGANPTPEIPADDELAEVERVAVHLAGAAGQAIREAVGSGFRVEYKTNGSGESAPTDPVSEVDHAVEATIRQRVAEHFPDHAIIGEEIDEHPGPDADYLWVVDPVDGTTNFINGFPLFAASIAVLYRGVPVCGAIWVSASANIDAGVYHARKGSALSFDGNVVDPVSKADGVRRKLAAAPGGSPGRTAQWDHRVTGSAALECAFVAAGIFTSARFGGLRIWDVAAGVVLVEAAGGEAWVQEIDGWHPLHRFQPPLTVKEDRSPTLRDWSRPLIIGTPEATHTLVPGPKKGIWQRAKQLVFPGH